MAEDDSNCDLFVTLANDADDMKSRIDTLVLQMRGGTRFKQMSMADFLNSVAVFHSKVSGSIRGTLKLAYESEKAKVIELQKKVADLEVSISESNLTIKTMGEELEASEKKLAVSNNVNKDLKNQQSIQDSLINQMLQDIRTDKSLLESKTKQIDSQTEKIHGYQEKLSLCAADISEHDNQITELNKKNKQYMSEILQLKSTHKAKEDNWKTNIRKLEMELEEKVKSVDDLNKKFNGVMLEKNEVHAQLVTLRAEKCTRENLIQELETRLNALQAEHIGVLASFNNAEEVKNELTTKVVELEKEVDLQNQVILYRTNEKMEAIRQLSSSLEHYKSRYKEIHKEFVRKNTTCCFNFLN